MSERPGIRQLAAKIQAAQKAEYFAERRAFTCPKTFSEVERRAGIEQQPRPRSIAARRRQKKYLIHVTDYDT